jgi:hypothetical protein
MTETLTAPAAAPATDELTPGRYMRLRREAAGLSIDDVAARLSGTTSGAAGYRVLVEALERNDPMSGAELTLIDDLADARIFSFDPAIYYMLVGRRAEPGAAPLPGICRSCGCTWNDACVDDERGPCAWANADATLCSHCQPPPAPVVAINGHAHPAAGSAPGEIRGGQAHAA